MTARSLTVEQVTQARLDAAAGRQVVYIAADLGVKFDVAWRAVRGQTWKELADPPPVTIERETLTCCDCGRPHHNRTRGGRCKACYLAWSQADRPDPPPAIDRTGWRHCPRCTLLTPQGGLCEWCVEETAN